MLTPPPTSVPREERARLLAAAAALVLLIAAVYLPALRGGFLWDDDSHVSANPVIVGPGGLKEIWTTAAANYFPLVLTNFWVQHALWGLNPLGYHLVTLLFHAAGALVLWRALAAWRVPGAWLAAAAWALHPVQVESVAWICELKNTQSGFFYFLAIWFYLRWLDANHGPDARVSRRGYILALLCAVLALLSKPSTVMLPVVLGLAAWWRRRVFSWRDFVSLIPFLALSAVASGWTIWEQRVHSTAVGPEWDQSFAERLILAGRCIWFYLGKLGWPEPLMFLYPRWQLDAAQVGAYLAPLGAVAIFGFLWWRRQQLPAWFVAAAYFGALLFPVLGFFNIYFFRYSFVGDHFQYLASVGPLALAAGGLTLALARAPRAARGLIPACLLGGLALLSRQETWMYRSPETFYRTILADNPQAWLAHNNFAELLEQRGQDAEAAVHYQTALRLNPEFAEAHNSYGALLARQPGRQDEAIAHFQKAVQLRPPLPEAHNNLAVQLARQPGRLGEALAHYEQALRLNPHHAEVNYNLAVELTQQGRLEDAIAHFERALRTKPRYAEAHNNLGAALARMPGRSADAIAHYEQALKLKPDYAEAHNNLANELAKQPGKMADAIAHYERALKINPGFAAAHYNLANKLAKLPGRSGDALRHYEDALQADPNFAVAYFALGSELAKLPTRQEDALGYLSAAVQLEPQSITARKTFATVLARNGHTAEAIRQWEAILSAQPNNEEAQRALAGLR